MLKLNMWKKNVQIKIILSSMKIARINHVLHARTLIILPHTGMVCSVLNSARNLPQNGMESFAKHVVLKKLGMEINVPDMTAKMTNSGMEKIARS